MAANTNTAGTRIVCPNGCVSLASKTAYAAASPAPPAYGSKPLQSSKNGATVLTLWYEPLIGETGLATSTPWLKFGEIGERR